MQYSLVNTAPLPHLSPWHLCMLHSGHGTSPRVLESLDVHIQSIRSCIQTSLIEPRDEMDLSGFWIQICGWVLISLFGLDDLSQQLIAALHRRITSATWWCPPHFPHFYYSFHGRGSSLPSRALYSPCNMAFLARKPSSVYIPLEPHHATTVRNHQRYKRNRFSSKGQFICVAPWFHQ
jgi:hypothetical protein